MDCANKRTRVSHVNDNIHDVYIGRPSPWGNPFIIGRDGSREEVIEKYKHWVLTEWSDAKILETTLALRGKTLGCWCFPNACHGDILVSLVEGVFFNGRKQP